MDSRNRNIIVVCGPTASGKTRLAAALARAFGGEIISADSRQVYRGMDIGTGKDLDEYGSGDDAVPHHLIDIADPAEMYTLYQYQRDCYAAIRSVWSRQKIPVLCGGTGLYIEAVLKGYRMPEVAEDTQLRETLMAEEKNTLEQRLKTLDPRLYERTDRSSKKRIVRAIEVAMHTEKGTVHEQKSRADTPMLRPLVLGVRWPREELVRRIDERLEKRLEQGMVDEVRRLLAQGVSRKRFALFGMEYKHIARFLDGETDYEHMKQELKTAIHRLAKRQMTWFRGMQRRGIEVQWVERGDAAMAAGIVRHYQLLPSNAAAALTR